MCELRVCSFNFFIPLIYIRDINKSEFEQNEKLQKIVDQYNIKLYEKDENILKVSCVYNVLMCIIL
jgi:hypothetical protein